MYEEPYRWVEAVANRRQYLDDQFIQGNPILAFSCAQGILLLTFHRGTPKLYEIYDRIALGGMGHPADLEKLRFSLLDLAHVEGFQRSPSDVTASRLTKNGLAPVVKQAFEEIFRAPYIAKILLAEVGTSADRDRIFTINYDGLFEESSEFGVLTAEKQVEEALRNEWKQHGTPESLEAAVASGLQLWGAASLLQMRSAYTGSAPRSREEEKVDTPAPAHRSMPDQEAIRQRIHEVMKTETLECVLLDRSVGVMETYHALSTPELLELLPTDLRQA
jgi:proteasome alpha subunit